MMNVMTDAARPASVAGDQTTISSAPLVPADTVGTSLPVVPSAGAGNSRLMNKLRGSFSPTVQKIINQVREEHQVAQKKQSFSDDEQLVVLDEVLTEVEQAVPAPPASELTLTPLQPPAVEPPPEPLPEPPLAATGANDLPSAPDETRIEPSVIDQALPAVTLQNTDTLNPATAATSQKESLEKRTPDTVQPDTSGGFQLVEQEKQPEMPVEVEGFLERVEDHADRVPHEIVISGQDINIAPSTNFPATPVVVLPITPEVEKQGKRKNLHWSVRWLVEWSERIIKMFSGKVIYRET